MKSATFKTTLSIITVAILLMTLPQCKKLLDAKNIEAKFDVEFSIDISENDELQFLDEKLIDLNSNQEFADNKDKIDEYSIKKIYYKIVAYEGESGIIASGVLTFKDDLATIGDPITQDNLNLSALFSSGVETDLPFTSNTENQLVEVLKSKGKFTVKLEGLSSGKPMFFTTKLTIVVGAKVNP
jgi:hypothetical protein